MARNPKSNENLKPIKKGELSREEAKARGSAGGKKSVEVRRAKRDAKSAVRYLLDLAAKGNLNTNLKELGIPENERTNMAALQARLFTSAMSGNLEAYKELMKIGGFDSEENRKERESISADRRRELELDAKIEALRTEGVSTSLNMNDEDGNSDVVIYIPETESEEDCELPEEDEDVVEVVQPEDAE